MTTETTRLVRNLTSSYRRLDAGQLTGRNSTASDGTRAMNWARLQDALEAGGYEELDADPTLARQYAALERRHLLGQRAADRHPVGSRTILTWAPRSYGSSRGYLYGAGARLVATDITQAEARERYEDGDVTVTYDRDGLGRMTDGGHTVREAIGIQEIAIADGELELEDDADRAPADRYPVGSTVTYNGKTWTVRRTRPGQVYIDLNGGAWIIARGLGAGA